jgi:hypothetical protein
MITALIIAGIYASGYALCVTGMQNRVSADDRASWPFALWISLQWPRFAWWAVLISWWLIRAEADLRRARRRSFGQ